MEIAIPLQVRLPASERSSPADLADLPIVTGGRVVRLGEVAQIKPTLRPQRVERVDGHRIESVSADLAPGVSRAVLGELQTELLAPLQVAHPELVATMGGAQQESDGLVAAMASGYVLSLISIYALLAIPFRSYIQPVIVMAAIPFGLVGAVMGHLVMGYAITMVSVLGLIALSGVVVNDSLVLVHTMNGHVDQGMSAYEAASAAGVERFRPILLTSLTTSAGLFPMILETSNQGRFLVPMALSLGFGLVVGTLFLLLLVPVLYTAVDDVRVLLRRGTDG